MNETCRRCVKGLKEYALNSASERGSTVDGIGLFLDLKVRGSNPPK